MKAERDSRRSNILAWSLAAFAVVMTFVEFWMLVISPAGRPINDPSRSAATDYPEFFLFVVVGAPIPAGSSSTLVRGER